ncbi:MAG: hypothetical protein EA001_07600 [Oscillatoriales cyanobacterium]|nr:MAG: hypothetical protein EA001_07600 [Oscillatoriales cyanobacterium]
MTDRPVVPDRPYQAMAIALAPLRVAIAEPAPSIATVQAALDTLQQTISQLPPASGLEQSLQVEIHKQWRLLQADFAFLRAARQPATLAQRQTTMLQRLDQLTSYCESGDRL